MNDNLILIALFIIAFISLGLFTFIGFIEGGKRTQIEFKKELVTKGYAEYYLDNNYEKQWRMKGGVE